MTTLMAHSTVRRQGLPGLYPAGPFQYKTTLTVYPTVMTQVLPRFI